MSKFLEKLKKVTAPILLVTFLNIEFFMVVQIFFFYFIASKQIDVIIESKADIINKFSESSNILKCKINSYLNSDEFKKNKNYSDEINKKRMKLNLDIIVKRKLVWLIIIGIFIFISFSVAISGTIISRVNKNDDKYVYWKSQGFSKSDLILILFVICAFTTEIAFFFLMVKKYEFIGDMEIINFLYKNVSKILNKKIEEEKEE